MSTLKLPECLHELARELPLTLTKEEACDVLRVTRITFERAVAAHELTVIKSGPARQARVLVSRSELLRWMAARTR